MEEISNKPKKNFSPMLASQYQIPESPVIVFIVQTGPFFYEYQLKEPELSKEDAEIIKNLRSHFFNVFLDTKRKTKFIQNFSMEFALETSILYPSLSSEKNRVYEYYIFRDAGGFGQVQPLIDDPFISLISINGPDGVVGVNHSTYETIFTPIRLTGGDIRTLVKKLCNRSIHPVDYNDPPDVLQLRNRMKVHFSRGKNNSIPLIFTIEKPVQDEKSPAQDNILFSYHLYHDMIDVKIIASPPDRFFYDISIIPLSEYEENAIKASIEYIKQKSGLQTFREGAFRISENDFSGFLKKNYPDLPDRKHHLLYTALTFRQDIVKWIRVILADPNVTKILCTYPGKPVIVWHNKTPGKTKTSITPGRSDLNRFATFLIKSSKKEVEPSENEITIQFKTGEKIFLTRIRDEKSHYFQIEIVKSGIKDILPEKKNRVSVPKIPHSSETEPDERINALISRIFDRDQKEEVSELTVPPDGLLDIPDEEKGLTRLFSPLKKGLKEFSITGYRRKEKPLHDEAPVPDTLQVPSIQNIQAVDGVVAEEAYWLYQPHAYAVIIQDKGKERSYRVVEPELSSRERIVLEETHETLRDVLVYDKPVSKGDLFLEYGEVAKVVRTYDPKISDDRLSVIYYYLRRNLNGYGKIDPLMYDELLEDISCNGHGLPVYIHHRYYGSIPTSIKFESEELNRFVLKLSQKADKQVSLTSPLLDASLPNGARAQITYSDVVSTKGSSFTIRKFRSDPMTPATLLAFGTYSDELLAFIWLALENRQSLIVVGGTASGKTSAMNAFSFFIPHNSKIVSLEDTREIQIPQKNWLPVQTRTSNSFNERGSVDLFDLLKASLRQRPEYIIVGEVRGNEAQTLFQAMNSGHTTLSTLHAGNIEEALNRLTNEPINVPPAMFGALNLMIIQTFHYRGGRMIRRCDAIHEIVLGEGDRVNWNTLYEYEPNNDLFKRVFKESKTLQTIQYMHNWSDEELQYNLDLRASFLARLRNQYSTDPEILIQMISDLRRMA